MRARHAFPLLALLAACQHHPALPAAEGMKPWRSVLAVSTPIPGVVPIRLRRDHAVLLDLKPADLDHDLGLALTLRRGSGTLGLVDGMGLVDPLLVTFRREGDKVFL